MPPNTTQKDIEKGYKYFEEATIVFKILEEKIDAFNKASSNFKNIEERIDQIQNNLIQVSKNTNLKNIENKFKQKSDEVLDLLDEIEDKYTERLQQNNRKNISLALTVGLTTMVTAIVVTGVFVFFEIQDIPVTYILKQLAIKISNFI